MFKILTLAFLLTIAFCFVQTAIAQQQILGTFPQMDGGFEGQTIGTIPTAASISAGTQSTTWTTRNAGSGTINSSTARTGSNYATFQGVEVPTTRDRLQTPTAGVDAVLSSTLYTVQFYYRTSGSSTPAPSYREGLSPNGTTNLSIFSWPVINGTSGTWVLCRDTVSTPNIAGTGKYGLASLGIRDTAMTAPMDIDDVVIYPGMPDSIAPDPATAPLVTGTTSSQINLAWTDPVSGIDGGGYLVVRKQGSAPTTAPNANGLYAVGQSVASGEVVVYLGTSPLFADNGLSPNTHYYYRIYTVDKAFNFSTGVAIDGSTTTQSLASEPTVQASGVNFTGVASASFTINWTNGNGSSHLVILHEGIAVNTDPVDGATYTASAAFGTPASQIGVGNYIVYKGAGSTVTVTGLSKLTTYYASVYDFNGTGGSENYLMTSPATGSQLTLAGSITSAQSGDWAVTTTWVGGVVPGASDNITIAGGHAVTIPATVDVNNLAISPGGSLSSGQSAAIAGNNIRYVRVHGATLMTDGTFGGVSDGIGIECAANVTITGSGTMSPCRLRPASNMTDITITIDQDMTLTYTGSAGTGGTALHTENGSSDNITITVNPGKIVTFVDFANLYLNSSNGNSVTGTTFNVNGSILLSGANSNFGLKTVAGKTSYLNVNGTVTVGRNLNATSAVGGGAPVITVNGSGNLTVHGIADFTDSSSVLAGSGTLTLPAGAVMYIGSPYGISGDGATGTIKIMNRSFDPGANFRYDGLAHQITGTGLPPVLNQLTLSDSQGVTLSSDVTVNDTLHVSLGDFNLNGFNVTLGPSGYLREPSGNVAFGSVGTITATRTLNAPSIADNIAGLGLYIGSSANLGSTTITRGHGVQGGVSIKRYFDIAPSNNSGLNATMVFAYDRSEVGTIDETRLALFQSTDQGVSWIKRSGTPDGTLHQVTLTGINSFALWTAGDSTVSFPVSRRFAVNAGWNLISIPYHVHDGRKTVLFPGAISRAFAYSNQYVVKDTLQHGIGYWLKMPAKDTLLMVGTDRLSDTITVNLGWNMIGSITTPVKVTTISSIPPAITASNFFSYLGNYKVADTILPGRGYWIKANQAGQLVLSVSGAADQSSLLRIIPSVELPPSPPASETGDVASIPASWSLGDAYPNPFNPVTRLTVAVPEAGPVSVVVYDLLGRSVTTLLSEQNQPAGYHTIEWNGMNSSGISVPSGVYFVKMTAGSFDAVRKLMLLK